MTIDTGEQHKCHEHQLCDGVAQLARDLPPSVMYTRPPNPDPTPHLRVRTLGRPQTLDSQQLDELQSIVAAHGAIELHQSGLDAFVSFKTVEQAEAARTALSVPEPGQTHHAARAAPAAELPLLDVRFARRTGAAQVRAAAGRQRSRACFAPQRPLCAGLCYVRAAPSPPPFAARPTPAPAPRSPPAPPGAPRPPARAGAHQRAARHPGPRAAARVCHAPRGGSPGRRDRRRPGTLGGAGQAPRAALRVQVRAPWGGGEGGAGAGGEGEVGHRRGG